MRTGSPFGEITDEILPQSQAEKEGGEPSQEAAHGGSTSGDGEDDCSESSVASRQAEGNNEAPSSSHFNKECFNGTQEAEVRHSSPPSGGTASPLHSPS